MDIFYFPTPVFLLEFLIVTIIALVGLMISLYIIFFKMSDSGN